MHLFFQRSLAKTMGRSAKAPSRDVRIGGKGLANGISSSASVFFHGIMFVKIEHIPSEMRIELGRLPAKRVIWGELTTNLSRYKTYNGD